MNKYDIEVGENKKNRFVIVATKIPSLATGLYTKMVMPTPYIMQAGLQLITKKNYISHSGW